MERNETLSAITPLLRHRLLRVLLIAAPGITAAVAIVTATESNLAFVIVLNAAAGIVISSGLFIVVSILAGKVADERVGLAQVVGQRLRRARSPSLSIDDESGLYTDWYFRLRLQEEIDRSQRHDLHVSVLLVNSLDLQLETEQPAATAWFGDQIHNNLRRSDLLALLQDGSLAILLPMTGRRAAQLVRRRVIEELASVDARVGLATFPEDGEVVTTLLAAAANDVFRTRQKVSA